MHGRGVEFTVTAEGTLVRIIHGWNGPRGWCDRSDLLPRRSSVRVRARYRVAYTAGLARVAEQATTPRRWWRGERTSRLGAGVASLHH
jgi:hypothetical protein